MINRIINAILLALYNEFGDAYTLYTEDVDQNMAAPAFYVKCVSPEHRTVVGRTYKEDNLFVISYFPKNGDYRDEINDVLHRLYFALELVPDINDSKIRGTSMRGEIVDGVLHFMVNYNVFVREIIDQTKMTSLDVKESVKE